MTSQFPIGGISESRYLTMVDFRINGTRQTGAVRNHPYRGSESVYLFLSFTINDPMQIVRGIACKYCVTFTPRNRENRHLFPLVVTGCPNL